MVMIAVLSPMRAAAMAASHPACPAPTTATSYCSVNAIQGYSTDFVESALMRPSSRRPDLTSLRDLCSLKFQDDGGAARLKIHGGGMPVVIAKDGGADAESQARRFSDRLGGDKRIKRPIGIEKAGTGMRNEDLDGVALARGLKANGPSLKAAGVCAFIIDGFDRELKAVQHCCRIC